MLVATELKLRASKPHVAAECVPDSTDRPAMFAAVAPATRSSPRRSPSGKFAGPLSVGLFNGRLLLPSLLAALALAASSLTLGLTARALG
jgi:hypothetical protein